MVVCRLARPHQLSTQERNIKFQRGSLHILAPMKTHFARVVEGFGGAFVKCLVNWFVKSKLSVVRPVVVVFHTFSASREAT
jgi:hypothetical protein